MGFRSGFGLAVFYINIFGHHEEDMEFLLALVASQSPNRMFGVIPQRNMDYEFFERGPDRPLAANWAIAVKRHTHLRSYRLGGMEPRSDMSSGC